MSFGAIVDPMTARVLLSPINNPVLGRTVCNMAGTFYPVYATFRALERRENDFKTEKQRKKESDTELESWACYWVVYGAFKVLEGLTDPFLSWVPYYFPAKLAFLLWLQMPQFNGAKQIYLKYLRPVLFRYKPKIDIILERLKKEEWIIEAQKPYFRMMYNTMMIAHRNMTDFIRWFFDKKDSEADAEAQTEITTP